MRTTAGVFEAYTELFIVVPDESWTEITEMEIAVPTRDQYVFGFLGYVTGITSGSFTTERLTALGAKELSREQLRKYAAMETADFAKALFDIATRKGKYSTNFPTIEKYVIRAAYVFYQVDQLLQWQNETFAPVMQNKGVNALASINSGIVEMMDAKTHKARIRVGDVVFEIEGYTGKTSTAALILNDMFLCYLAENNGNPSLEIDLRDIAMKKGRSTSKQAIYKLRNEVISWMDEIASIKYRCRELIDGVWKESGEIGINGGTHFIKGGIVYWNYNPDLSASLALLAPMDYARELWKVDPRTNQFYFGRYIDLNYRRNEGKKGRERIAIRTLINQSSNMPTYEEVIKSSSRHVTDRIVRPTFEDLDALDHIFYTVETEDGKPIDNPENMDYDTFINSYIVVDYNDFPSHTKRIDGKQHRKRLQAAAQAKKQAEAKADAAKV